MKKVETTTKTNRDVFIADEWETRVGLKAMVLRIKYTEKLKKYLKEKGLWDEFTHDWWTGYVKKPDGYKYDPSDNLEVHGGVTFTDGTPIGAEENTNWIGFDLNHYSDTGNESLEYVKEECERLAEQLLTNKK